MERTAAVPGQPVCLTEDVEWIGECYPLEDGRHMHVSVYLIRTPSGNIVIDSGSFYHREAIERRITAATSGEGIHSLILSHSDYPHSGNIAAFRREWGDFEIVASCGDPDIQGLPYATQVNFGETHDVLGRPFTFLDPPLADRSHTSWIYDRASRVMFVADGFGNFHAGGACHARSPELPEDGRDEGIHDFHAGALVWLRYADPPKLMRVLRGMFEAHPVSWVAPIHGNPIADEDLEDYLARLEASIASIAAGYRVPGANPR